MNHIKNPHAHDIDRAWCGAKLDNSFHFKDLDQVIINNICGERIPCLQCIHGIINILTTQSPNIPTD
jgi:hypothetical protein